MRGIALALALTLGAGSLAVTPALAQATKSKAAKGEKTCRVKLKYSGEVKVWKCKVDEPCCVWHEINYVKCGSPTFKCL